jgi:hypothetical protein
VAHAPLHDDWNELSDPSAAESLELGFDGRPHVALGLRLLKLVNNPGCDRPDVARIRRHIPPPFSKRKPQTFPRVPCGQTRGIGDRPAPVLSELRGSADRAGRKH